MYQFAQGQFVIDSMDAEQRQIALADYIAGWKAHGMHGFELIVHDQPHDPLLELIDSQAASDSRIVYDVTPWSIGLPASWLKRIARPGTDEVDGQARLMRAQLDALLQAMEHATGDILTAADVAHSLENLAQLLKNWNETAAPEALERFACEQAERLVRLQADLNTFADRHVVPLGDTAAGIRAATAIGEAAEALEAMIATAAIVASGRQGN
jgi:hypothetical protein